MNIKLKPQYTLTQKLKNGLKRIDDANKTIIKQSFPIELLENLKEVSNLYSHHNLQHEGLFPHLKKRIEFDKRGYFAAQNQLKLWMAENRSIDELMIRTTHSILLGNGKTDVDPQNYRDYQSHVRASGVVMYTPPPPEAVPDLMFAMVNWINENSTLPSPLVAGIAHYMLKSIHPFYDANSRSSRILAKFILDSGGYHLNGLYTLEEYGMRNLEGFYKAYDRGFIEAGVSKWIERDITLWLEYFIEGLAISFENVQKRISIAYKNGHNEVDIRKKITNIDPWNRKVIERYPDLNAITNRNLANFFEFKDLKITSKLCVNWMKSGFLNVSNSSKKGRMYSLSEPYQDIVEYFRFC